MKNILYIILMLLLISLNTSFAQKENGKGRFSDEINKVVKQKLMDSLKMDEATADKFMNIVKENNQKIKKLGKERKSIMNSIEQNPYASDIESRIDNLIEIDSKITGLRSDFIKELKTFLTPQQIARSMILRKNFNKELKSQIRKRNRERNNQPEDFNK